MYLKKECAEMKYQKGYKYQLYEDEFFLTKVFPDEDIRDGFISLTTWGDLTIKKGYAWDGPSGPTIDTKSFRRGSLAHDALYQILRTGKLDKKWRKEADYLLHDIIIQDGMCKIRAWWVMKGVRNFAGFAANPKNAKRVYSAP